MSPNKKSAQRRGTSFFNQLPALEHLSELEDLPSKVINQKVTPSKATKKPRKLKKQKATTVKKHTVESDLRNLLQAAEGFVAALQVVKDADGLGEWLEENQFEETDKVQDLQEKCKVISNLLKFRTTPKEVSAGGLTLGVQEGFHSFFVYRGPSKSVQILAPVKVFKATANYTASKTFGFVQRKGADGPLMCALSGWTPCIENHQQMLENDEFWTAEVRRLKTMYELSFKADGFDEFHGKEIGTGFASHVEMKLTLFYAYRLLKKFTGEEPKVTKLQRLTKKKSGKEAEIFLTAEPCKQCRDFAELIENITGIEFTFIVIPNLGKILSYRDSRGYKRPSKFAWDGSDSELQAVTEEYEGSKKWVKELEKIVGSAGQSEEISTTTGTLLQVVINSKPADKYIMEGAFDTSGQIFTARKSGAGAHSLQRQHENTKSPNHPQSKFSRERSYASGVITEVTTKVSSILKTPRKRLQNNEDEEDVEDWQPPRTKIKTTYQATPSFQRKSLRTGLLSPDYSPRTQNPYSLDEEDCLAAESRHESTKLARKLNFRPGR